MFLLIAHTNEKRAGSKEQGDRKSKYEGTTARGDKASSQSTWTIAGPFFLLSCPKKIWGWDYHYQ